MVIGGRMMTRIPTEDRDLLEKAIYYPMVLKVLERDLQIIKNSPFKLPNPYIAWISETIITIQKQLYFVKKEMKKKGIKVEEVKRDNTFTTFLFIYKGYEEHHNYFNPRLRNKVEELLTYFLFKRFLPDDPYKQSFG